jgi:F-type H+-transporting ATPase subunit alpha
MTENRKHNVLLDTLAQTFSRMNGVLDNFEYTPRIEEVGTVTYVGPGTVTVKGLHGVQSEELLRFEGNLLGMAFNVDRDRIGVILLDESDELRAGHEVYRTGRVLDIAVGDELLGRIIDGQGRPLDDGGPLKTDTRRELERTAPAIMDRLPVTVPLQTGLKVVDAMIPIGRGQRELIVGDRQTGKTAIAVDTILNQKDRDVICIYCALGKRASAVAKVIAELRERDAMAYSIVLIATEEDPPGLQFITPYAATTVGEYFMEQGRDVLVVYDDLTRHARAYREVSLLLRRPPGREAFPGDIFYIHSRLLERSTHLKENFGGGSLTSLPIVETEAQNISAYIPTNLISITDGQIYLSPDLFRKGILPAVDVGKSVSRVGGKTQLAAYRSVAGDLRLSYSQFEELENFARFGTQMDDDTRQALERGKRVREVLKQNQYRPIDVCQQIAVLVCVNEGVFDVLAPGRIPEVEYKVRTAVGKELPQVCRRIADGENISRKDIDAICEMAKGLIGKVGDDDNKPLDKYQENPDADN